MCRYKLDASLRSTFSSYYANYNIYIHIIIIIVNIRLWQWSSVEFRRKLHTQVSVSKSVSWCESAVCANASRESRSRRCRREGFIFKSPAASVSQRPSKHPKATRLWRADDKCTWLLLSVAPAVAKATTKPTTATTTLFSSEDNRNIKENFNNWRRVFHNHIYNIFWTAHSRRQRIGIK